MNYRLTTHAKNDVRDIHRYTVKHFGNIQAEHYLGGLNYTFDLLTDNPKLGMPANGNTRCFIYKEHNVIYSIENETVVILRVIHSRMKLP